MDTAARLVKRMLTTRWVVRAPIWLYKLRLGPLFGHRMLMLEHRGRKSGLPRYVVLEVADRPSPDRYIVPSGFGAESQWYRNVLADPAVRVSVGFRRRVPAQAGALDAERARTTLESYQRRHPIAWRLLAPTMQQSLGTDDLAVPMVELALAR